MNQIDQSREAARSHHLNGHLTTSHKSKSESLSNEIATAEL